MNHTKLKVCECVFHFMHTHIEKKREGRRGSDHLDVGTATVRMSEPMRAHGLILVTSTVQDLLQSSVTSTESQYQRFKEEELT